jgi:hypothetical protein
MSKNTPAERLYFEIADAIDLLDNVTAATDRDADDLGQAELALIRAHEIILKTSLRLIDEAPAMLAALRHALQALEGDWERTREVDEIRAILSRIDGAPTAQPAAPISEAGDRCASCGAEEGESHGAQCEARGFAMGAAIKRGEG